MSWKPTGSLENLHDTTERKRMDVEGDGKLREGGWWMEWGKGVPMTTLELKTKVGRWPDLLKKLGEVSLWNEIGEGLVKESEDDGWMKLGWGCRLWNLSVLLKHLHCIKHWNLPKNHTNKKNLNYLKETKFHELVIYLMHEQNFVELYKTLMRSIVILKIEEMITKSYSCKLIKCWPKYKKTLNTMRK